MGERDDRVDDRVDDGNDDGDDDEPMPSAASRAALTEGDLPKSSHVFAALEDYFSTYGAARHQVESFDHFLNFTLKTIISENSDVTSMTPDGLFSYHLQFCNVCVHKPCSREVEGFERPLMPHSARLRGLTYSSTVCVDVVHDKVDRRGPEPRLAWRKVYHGVVLTRLPIMTGSAACHLSDPCMRDRECMHDRGGLFIINGHDKALVSQQKLRVNIPFVFAGKPPKQGLVCEVRSCHELKLRSTSTCQIITTVTPGGGLPSIVCRLPFLQCLIPLPMLFRVLGATTREEAMSYIQTDTPLMRHIVRSVFDADEHAGTTQEEAFDLLGREATRETTRERREKYCYHILGNELLPHVGLRMDKLCNQRKMHFIGYMVRRLLRVHLGFDDMDDRDDLANKRVDSAGSLMGLLMRQLFRATLKSISVTQHRLVLAGTIDTTAFAELITDKRITSGYKYCFATGNWNATKSGLTSQNGVAQVVARMTALSLQSCLRRINTPIAREGKCPAPRQLHPTAFGFVCPSESPEGTGCGLVNNLSLLTHIRTGCYSTPIAECIIRALPVKVIPLLVATREERENGTMVFVNGVSIGFVAKSRAARLVELLRGKRRQQEIPFDTSITHIGTSVHVASDPGGLTRPLIIASEIGRLNAVVEATPAHQNLFQALLYAGVIEYVDTHEISTLRVAVRHKDLLGDDGASYTHCEIDPCLIMGVMASLIPFSNHDQAPRVTYQSAMGKQACGVYATNWTERMEAISHVQMYPQVPLVMTKIERLLRAETVPSGANVMVCICSLGGWNQEDSLIINRGSVERGLFRTIVHRTIKDEEKKGADAEVFENPAKVHECAGLRVGCYDKLGPDAVASVGTTVNMGDCLIGKCISTSDVAEQGESRNTVKRDKSTLQRHDEQATVDMVLHTRTRDGTNAVKVRTRAVRIPQVGDKVRAPAQPCRLRVPRAMPRDGLAVSPLAPSPIPPITPPPPPTDPASDPHPALRAHAPTSPPTPAVQLASRPEGRVRPPHRGERDAVQPGGHAPGHRREHTRAALAHDDRAAGRAAARHPVLRRGRARRRLAVPRERRPQGHRRRARSVRAAARRQPDDAQRPDGRAAPDAVLLRPHVLPEAQAHGHRQAARARARALPDPDAPAARGARAHGRAAVWRDGARHADRARFVVDSPRVPAAQVGRLPRRRVRGLRHARGARTEGRAREERGAPLPRVRVAQHRHQNDAVRQKTPHAGAVRHAHRAPAAPRELLERTGVRPGRRQPVSGRAERADGGKKQAGVTSVVGTPRPTEGIVSG